MIYLNNSATSFPKPPAFAGACREVSETLPAHGGRSTLHAGQREPSCRELLAELLGVPDSDRIVYTLNATHALNMGLLGFPWKKGDVVLTTKAEHNSVLRPLYYLHQQGIIRYYELDTEPDGRLDMEMYTDALKSLHPRMLVFTHASNVTGAVNDAAAITALARRYGCTVFIDAAQTAGLVPVRPLEWQADMVALTGHKYLLGPQGTGALYVSPHISLHPVFTGGTGIHSDEDRMPDEYPLRLEAGTQNETGFALLGKMLCWAKENPARLDDILELTNILEQTLERLGCRVIRPAGLRTPVTAFTTSLYSPADMGDILTESFDIICRTGLHCAPHILPCIGADERGTIRFSLSRFTTRQEIEEVITALKEILRED